MHASKFLPPALSHFQFTPKLQTVTPQHMKFIFKEHGAKHIRQTLSGKVTWIKLAEVRRFLSSKHSTIDTKYAPKSIRLRRAGRMNELHVFIVRVTEMHRILHRSTDLKYAWPDA